MNKPYSEFPDVLIDPSRFRDRIAALLVTAGYLGDRGCPILSAEDLPRQDDDQHTRGRLLGVFGGSRSYVSGSKIKQYRHYHTTMNGIEITACEPVEGDE